METTPGADARPAAARPPAARPPAAVLFDRDGTLVVDVPYNGDPDLVRPVPGAVEVLRRLHARGVPTAVVSNQSGIARGLLTREQVEAVNARVDELLGPFGAWAYCPHGEADGCRCRKPAPGLVLDAAAALGVDPTDTAVIGDIAADVGAAAAAGARAVLVPTPATRREEVDAAPLVADDLAGALALLGLGEMGLGDVGPGEVGPGEVGLGEVGPGEVALGEVALGEAGPGEVGQADEGPDGVDGGRPPGESRR